MIPDKTGSTIIRAQYYNDQGRRVDIEMAVVAWDDDGCPLVVGNKGLVRADRYTDFKVVREGASERITSIVPAGPGWWISGVVGGCGDSTAVAAFGLTAAGRAVSFVAGDGPHPVAFGADDRWDSGRLVYDKGRTR